MAQEYINPVTNWLEFKKNHTKTWAAEFAPLGYQVTFGGALILKGQPAPGVPMHLFLKAMDAYEKELDLREEDEEDLSTNRKVIDPEKLRELLVDYEAIIMNLARSSADVATLEAIDNQEAAKRIVKTILKARRDLLLFQQIIQKTKKRIASVRERRDQLFKFRD